MDGMGPSAVFQVVCLPSKRHPEISFVLGLRAHGGKRFLQRIQAVIDGGQVEHGSLGSDERIGTLSAGHVTD
jgi:hypothetical protein